MSHSDIINQALLLLGESTISDLTDTDNAVVNYINLFYDQSWYEVLNSFEWSRFIVTESFSGTDSDDHKAYYTEYPSNMVRLVDVMNESGKSVMKDCLFYNSKIYTSEADGFVQYVTHEDVVPKETYTLGISDPMVENCVAHRLASKLAQKISQNLQLQQQLNLNYNQAFYAAMQADIVRVPRKYSGGYNWTRESWSNEDIINPLVE